MNIQYPNLSIEISEKIAIVTINNPPGNSLSGEVLKDIDSCINGLNENPDVKVIIFTGNGRIFATGADITEMGRCKSAEQAMEMSRLGQNVFFKIENSQKPVLAVINGFCLGGGLEFAISCHMRIASEHSVFGMPEITIGMIPAFGGSRRLPGIVGRGKALQMILTGEKILSQEALTIGLVNFIVPADKLMDEAKKLALKITGKSSLSIKHALRSVISGSYTDIGTAMEIESSCVGEMYNGHDLIEGVTAYLEKRKPDFLDR
jgi:enoyl-CoA hydratase